MASIHDGHRKRVRDRFRANGLEGFSAHEVLELLLFYTRPRGDVNPLAHALLDAFGSLKGVLEASPEQLMTVPGVGEETATMLSMMVPLFRQYQKSCLELVSFTHRSDVEKYCVALTAGLRTEHFYALLLNSKGQLLGRKLIAEGTLNEVNAYPRQVVEAALSHNAYSVVLCHNHPGGMAAPSRDDVLTTKMISSTLGALNVNLLDHMVVAGEQVYSMLLHGDLADVPQGGRQKVSMEDEPAWNEDGV